jgi:hypothetical protein
MVKVAGKVEVRYMREERVTEIPPTRTQPIIFAGGKALQGKCPEKLEEGSVALDAGNIEEGEIYGSAASCECWENLRNGDTNKLYMADIVGEERCRLRFHEAVQCRY